MKVRLTKKYAERIDGVDLVGRDVGEMPADAALFAALWRAAKREGRLRLFKTAQAAFESSDAAKRESRLEAIPSRRRKLEPAEDRR